MRLKNNEILILGSLERSPKRPTDLADELEIKPSNVSNYLNSLKLMNLVTYEQDGVERVYSIKSENKPFNSKPDDSISEYKPEQEKIELMGDQCQEK
jgi:DNA-binding IclR family transcriptional regulator